MPWFWFYDTIASHSIWPAVFRTLAFFPNTRLISKQLFVVFVFARWKGKRSTHFVPQGRLFPRAIVGFVNRVLEIFEFLKPLFTCFFQVTTITFAVSPTHPRAQLLSLAAMTSERGFGIVKEYRTFLTHEIANQNARLEQGENN